MFIRKNIQKKKIAVTPTDIDGFWILHRERKIILLIIIIMFIRKYSVDTFQ